MRTAREAVVGPVRLRVNCPGLAGTPAAVSAAVASLATTVITGRETDARALPIFRRLPLTVLPAREARGSPVLISVLFTS